MPWRPLSQTLGTKPRVLAGPMLRRVTPKSITVWLAMRAGASVVLTGKDDQNVQVMQGQQHSVAIGQNLHIVAVTAHLLPVFADAKEGVIYRYDLAFNFDDGFSCNLATATANAQLSYSTLGLPSFALPPADLNKLRLVQGSCRKPKRSRLLQRAQARRASTWTASDHPKGA